MTKTVADTPATRARIRRKTLTVCDGDLVLTLEPGKLGYYVVSSPLNPELLTQAKTVEHAFLMARDALQALAEARAKSHGRRRHSTTR